MASEREKVEIDLINFQEAVKYLTSGLRLLNPLITQINEASVDLNSALHFLLEAVQPDLDQSEE